MKKLTKTLAFAGAVTGLSLTAYIKAAESTYTNQIVNPDYLIILGYNLKDDIVTDMLQMRIDAAAEFLKNNPHTIAIPTGGITNPNQTVSEAQAIKSGLLAHGIDEERIILEDQAKTTVENFENCKSIIKSRCKNMNSARIGFITSDFHVLRSSIICKKAGLSAVGLPAPSPKKYYKAYLIREFLIFPSMYIEKMKGSK